MLASATSRLLNNVFYAHGQTRRPARIAMERVLISAAIGVVLMLWLDRWSVNQILGLEDVEPALFLGAVGLALGAGVASWYELGRLARSLRRDFGGLSLPWPDMWRLLGIAFASAVPGILVWRWLRSLPSLLLAPLALAVFAAGYLWLTRRLGVVTLGLWLGGRRQRGEHSGGEEGR
jgi:putative peptidoglycan lipid II flippase